MAKINKTGATATEIFDQIASSQSVRLAYTGLMRKSDNETEIEFSCGAGWEKIPATIIDGVAFIETRRVDAEEYPFVKLYLKEPETDEGRAFAAIARLSKALPATPTPTKILDLDADLPAMMRVSNYQAHLAQMLVSRSGEELEWDDGQRCFANARRECVVYAVRRRPTV